jgi:Na+/proline symporter
MGTFGNLAVVDALIVGAFLVAITVAGYALSRAASKGLDDYFLGGKKIPWWVLGVSTSSSNFDMSGTMIIVGLVFALGYKGFLVEMRGGVGIALAFIMIFLAKWLRRSRVMTSAQWMRLRFGTDRQGQAAHLLSAIANIALSLGMIIYFSKGGGKFLAYFLPFSEFTCIVAMVAVGLFYTLMSGLYGVVFTDVIQMVVMTLTSIFITAYAFDLMPTVILPSGFMALDLATPTYAGGALGDQPPETLEAIFAFFGVSVFLWVLRSTIEGMGGVGGYTDQRFFAARSEREAGLVALESIVLSAFRWTMIAGLVVMGYAIIAGGGDTAQLISQDPETVLPVVIGEMLPVGIKGIVIVGLIAAAMSTFDSTLNAGASYIVKDIYQTYLHPEASQRRLVAVSRWATLGLCVAGVGLASLIPNINVIWSFVTMGLGAGLFVPLFLRWYWPRLNGYGFAFGTAAGMIAGIAFKAILDWPLLWSFPGTIAAAFTVSVAVSLVTKPTDRDVLVAFWHQINPWGFWSAYARDAQAEGLVTEHNRGERTRERRTDMVSLGFALPFQVALLIAAMAFVFHDWTKFTIAGIVAIAGAAGLYVFWYRNLKTPEVCAAEDAHFEPLVRERIEPRIGSPGERTGNPDPK